MAKEIKILSLSPGDKFIDVKYEELEGVVLNHSNMGTSVYWYSVPDRWKKNYSKNKDLYEGLDVYYMNKKMLIGSETMVIKKGE